MQPLDFGVLVLYIVGCTVLGARIGASSEAKGLKGYFLGESNIPAWAVMISIVATETSAVTFLSVPGNATKGDMTFLQLAFGYIVARFVVTFVLLPAYFKKQIYTAYQVLELRFGGATQKAAAVLFLVTRTLASGLRLLLAAVVLKEITHWSLPVSIVVIGISTLAYTYLGGIKAVVWIDVLQFAVYLLAALIAMGILLGEIPGGWEEIWRRGSAAHKFRVINFGFDGVGPPRSVQEAASSFYAMLTQTYTFWGGLIGGLVLDTATHGADQMMVQRVLDGPFRAIGGAGVDRQWVRDPRPIRTLPDARRRPLGALPGPTSDGDAHENRPVLPLFHRPLYAHRRPRANRRGGLLGDDEHGLGRPSASASSTVNDLYRPLFPNTGEKQLMAISKGMTAFWGVVQMGVALASEGLSDSVVNNALSVASFVTGLLLGLFLLGLWTKNVGQRSAFIGLIAGTAAVTAVKLLTGVAYPWYALVGSGTVVAVGWLASQVIAEGHSRTDLQYDGLQN